MSDYRRAHSPLLAVLSLRSRLDGAWDPRRGKKRDRDREKGGEVVSKSMHKGGRSGQRKNRRLVEQRGRNREKGAQQKTGIVSTLGLGEMENKKKK